MLVVENGSDFSAADGDNLREADCAFGVDWDKIVS
jgi:hypothetical protein